MRRVLIGAILFYQRVLSPLKRPSCRYYPSCSAYALWLFEYSNIWSSIFKVCIRVSRCNQLFPGGIDYPIISLKLNPIFAPPRIIRAWFVPLEQTGKWNVKRKFYLIKHLH